MSSKINLKTKQKQNSISERYRMIHNEYFFSRDKKYEISSMWNICLQTVRWQFKKEGEYSFDKKKAVA